MLQMFRNMADTQITKWLLGLLVVSFAMWGVQDYIGGSSGGAALTVNGREIPLSEVDGVYRNRVKVIGQMMGKAPSPAELEQLNVPQMALTELIHRHVLNATTAELQLRPAASVLRAEISNTEVFQQDGKFSPERYKRMLAGQGMTTRAYEKMLAEQLSLAMMADLLALPQPKAEALLPLLNEAETTYTVEAFTLTPSVITGVEQPTEEILQGFYTTNEPAYALPEKRSFKVLTLNPETMAGTITLSDAQIEEHFNANKDAYKKPERRHVRHIVVADSAKAVELNTQIQTREQFIAMAEANTIDPSGKGKGGDLGIIAATDVVPAFADTAFALPVGKISEPVKTSFGWHLIWVDEILPAAEPVLAEVREKIKTELLQTQTTDALQNLLRTIDDRAAAGNTMDEIATATGLKTKQESLLMATSTVAEAPLIQAAFAAEQGRVEGPITLGDGSLAYLEVTAAVPASTPKLADIKGRVLADFMQAKTQKLLAELADTVARSGPANVGKPMAAIAGQVGKTGTTETITFTGPGDAPAWLHSRMMEVYQLPADGTLATSIANGSNRVMVRMLKREPKALDATAQTAAAAGYRQRLQQDVEALLLKELVGKAKIKYNTLQLRQIFGANWNPPQ